MIRNRSTFMTKIIGCAYELAIVHCRYITVIKTRIAKVHTSLLCYHATLVLGCTEVNCIYERAPRQPPSRRHDVVYLLRFILIE